LSEGGSVDFEFSQEHRLFRSSLREFLEKEIAPIVDGKEEGV